MLGHSRRVSPIIALLVAAAVLSTLSIGRAQGPTLVRDAARVERAASIRTALQQGLNYVPGELLVRFRSPLAGFANAQALSVLRTTVTPTNLRWIGNVLHLRRLSVDVLRAAEDLARQPEVAWAQPNYIDRPDSTPNDPGFSRQWNLPLINVPSAWDINTGAGRDVVIAVLDTGFTTTEGTFDFRIWDGAGFAFFPVPIARSTEFNFANVMEQVDLQPFGGWFNNSGPISFDADGHGMHVAGTIAQRTNNGDGFAGVANGARLLPIKVCFSPWDVQLADGFDGFPGFVPPTFGGCDSVAIVEGIRHAADSGAKVLNLSLGGPVPRPAYLDALQYAVSRGAFVAVSAGNDALMGNPTHYPAAYAAQINGVMSVAAVTPSLERALYSSFGNHVEIAAPGGPGSAGALTAQILQIAPNQVDLSIFRLAPAFNRYQELGISGTSMASPHVAAVAALLYSQGVRAPAAIEAVIRATARDLGPAGRDDDFGFGLIDARAAIFGRGVGR